MTESTRQLLVEVDFGAIRIRDYLASPEWLARRREALDRAGGRCQVCNRSDGILDTHHRTYERLGHEDPADLIVLCRSCHHLFHQNGKLSR